MSRMVAPSLPDKIGNGGWACIIDNGVGRIPDLHAPSNDNCFDKGFIHRNIIRNPVEDFAEGDHLAEAATRAGLDLADLDAQAVSDAAALDAEIVENQQALEAAGHWGVPTLVVEGEPFFGQDRIEMAKWRMEQKGLQKR